MTSALFSRENIFSAVSCACACVRVCTRTPHSYSLKGTSFTSLCTKRGARIFEKYVGILSLSRDKLKSLLVEGGERIINEHSICERSCCEGIESFYVDMCGGG